MNLLKAFVIGGVILTVLFFAAKAYVLNKVLQTSDHLYMIEVPAYDESLGPGTYFADKVITGQDGCITFLDGSKLRHTFCGHYQLTQLK